MLINKKAKVPPKHGPADGTVAPRDPQVQLLGGMLYWKEPVKMLLGFGIKDMETSLVTIGHIYTALGAPQITDAQRRELGKKAAGEQGTLVRAVAAGLRKAQGVKERTGEDPAVLENRAEAKPLLASIALAAEQAKAATLDALMINQAFGNYVVQQVMAWLREQLAAPGLTTKQQEELLADFAPLLVLMAEAQKGKQERQDTEAGKTQHVAAQLGDAQAQLHLQQTAQAVREGQVPDQAALLKAALEQQKQAAAAEQQVRTSVEDVLAAKQGQRRDTRR